MTLLSKISALDFIGLGNMQLIASKTINAKFQKNKPVLFTDQSVACSNSGILNFVKALIAMTSINMMSSLSTFFQQAKSTIVRV